MGLPYPGNRANLLLSPAQDDLGILVWQDFAFGCGAYPAYPAFVESVRREAEANVRRLRSHPCIAIYAGNNEDYQVAEQMNLDYDPEDRDGEYFFRRSSAFDTDV